MNKKIVDLITNEQIIEPLTADELTVWNEKKVLADKKAEEWQEKQNIRKNLLDRLGITEEEAKLLLG